MQLQPPWRPVDAFQLIDDTFRNDTARSRWSYTPILIVISGMQESEVIKFLAMASQAIIKYFIAA